MTREEAEKEIRYTFKEVWADGIIKALEQESRWIPMVRREPTEEEKADYLAQNGEELCYMLENEMPLNGQEVLVSIREFVSEDIFDEDFYNFENNDIENVDAWMPKPKPYKPQESEEKREMNPKEEILIEIIKVNNKEMSALFLQDYIQRHGPLSNEAGDIVKKLLEEKE